MTEQRQFEEMVKVMPEKIKDPLDNSRYIIFGKSLRREIARIYYNAGYRKVPDGALKLLLEAPYDELRKFCIKYYNEAKDLRQEVAELKAENERLKEVIAVQNELCWNCKKSVKEFAEKLKKRLMQDRVINDNVVIVTGVEIDELLKEYEE